MKLISAPPAETLILSAHAASIILSAGGTKQQSTKSCSRKCGNNDASRGDSGGGNRFDVGSNDCSDDSNGNSDDDGDSGDGDSGNKDSNSDSSSSDSNSSGKNHNLLKAAAEKVATAVNAAPPLNPSCLLSGTTSVQGGAESIILSAHTQSITLTATLAESMVLSAPPAESMILSAPPAESIIISAGGTKQQSTKSCSGKCGDDGGGRGDSDGSDRFDVSSGNDDCIDNSNGKGNVDGDSCHVDSGNNNCGESIMLSANGAEAITSLKPSKSRGSCPKNDIFSNGPNSTFECYSISAWCEYDILKVLLNKIDHNLPIGWVEHDNWVEGGISVWI
jgi:hypothetical protein